MNQIQFNPALTVEDFDDEVIIVNLHNGSYFSLKGTAAAIWKGLNDHPNVSSLIDFLGTRYTLDATSIADLTNFLKQCQEDELFSGSEIIQKVALPGGQSVQQGNPLLRITPYDKFSNMQDILLLDPIHDAGEMGWPYKRQEP